MSSIITQKRCSKCGIHKPATRDYFHYGKAWADGLRPECRLCRCKNPAHVLIPDNMKQCNKCHKILPGTTEYFHANPSGQYGVIGRCRTCVNKHTPKNKCIVNGAKRCTKCDKLYPATEKYFRLRPNGRTLFAACLNCQRLASSLWSKNNPEKARKHANDRNARKRNLTGTYTIEEICQLLNKQNRQCAYCGCDIAEKYEIDHIIPITRPGSRNDISNIALACPKCNKSKTNKTLEEWQEWKNKRRG